MFLLNDQTGHIVAESGARFYGQASPVREAAQIEIDKTEQRVKPTKWG